MTTPRPASLRSQVNVRLSLNPAGLPPVQTGNDRGATSMRAVHTP
jgi:hypothetical protein